MPTQRDIYDPRLTVVVPAVLVLSTWLGVATFLGMRYIGASLLVATFYGFSTFFLSLSPIKAYAINTAAMLSRFTRGRWLHRVMQYEPIDTAVYRNRPLARAEAARPPLTIMIPIYDEPFDLIRGTSLETAIREVENYGPLANLLVSDDGLMVFSDNALPEFEAAARAKPVAQRTRSEREVILRLDCYRELLGRPDLRFGVVARPKAVPARPETERRGTFKKASNLNFTHQLIDAVADLAREGIPHEAALEAALTRRLGDDHHRIAHARGEIAAGEVVLLLDKDSTVPTGASRDAVAEFAREPALAYIQAATSPINVADNYFAHAVAYRTQLIYDFAFPLAIATGSNVPLVGHNAYLRMTDLRRHGYWDEDRASEDYSFALDMAADGRHGKYLDLQHRRFGEMVSRDIEEEMQRVVGARGPPAVPGLSERASDGAHHRASRRARAAERALRPLRAPGGGPHDRRRASLRARGAVHLRGMLSAHPREHRARRPLPRCLLRAARRPGAGVRDRGPHPGRRRVLGADGSADELPRALPQDPHGMPAARGVLPRHQVGVPPRGPRGPTPAPPHAGPRALRGPGRPPSSGAPRARGVPVAGAALDVRVGGPADRRQTAARAEPLRRPLGAAVR